MKLSVAMVGCDAGAGLMMIGWLQPQIPSSRSVSDANGGVQEAVKTTDRFCEILVFSATGRDLGLYA